MIRSEREKMAAGDWYTCLDPELDALRALALNAVHQHNTAPPDVRGNIAPKLRALFGSVGENCRIEALFHCPYGFNIHLCDSVYMNAGCTILDTAPVHIGARCLLGPHVQIYTAQHHKDAVKRAAGLEIALPVTINDDVWIGGAAVIVPGVTIGARAIVGSGAVVTKDVVPDTVVVGNPARVVSNG
ncbi:MAG: sugar O-acetyltransferase [Ascidiaceihabitans sp.]|nr:sugar O-acetyltransferase [Ascidiaceihabitans sp.]